jgi:FixJ family two-component response regulator
MPVDPDGDSGRLNYDAALQAVAGLCVGLLNKHRCWFVHDWETTTANLKRLLAWRLVHFVDLPAEVEMFTRRRQMASELIPTVYVIDDDAGIRASIQGLLKSAGLHSVGFETAEQFLRTKAADVPGCLILDVSLPGISGLDFQQQLRDARRQIPIIFVTGHADIPMSVRAMKSGAVEFLTKPFGDQDLLDAVEQALARDSLSRKDRAELTDIEKRYDALTQREKEVMNLVVSGMLNKQIASELGTTEITIKVHRGRVMHKMQAGSLAELVILGEKLRRSHTE